MGTYGPAYEERLDGHRIRKQHEVVRDLMLDGAWRTLPEIARLTDYPEASISAQLRHLRKERFGAYTVEKRRRDGPGHGTWEYRVRPPRPKPPPEPPLAWKDTMNREWIVTSRDQVAHLLPATWNDLHRTADVKAACGATFKRRGIITSHRRHPHATIKCYRCTRAEREAASPHETTT